MALRSGAYVGEVMRRNSSKDLHWLEFKEASKVSSSIKDMGMQLGTAAVLWTEPDIFYFPLAKILKFIENGTEDNTYSFAKVILDLPSQNEGA